MRQKKLREEKRREKRIEIEENKKQGKCKQWRCGHEGTAGRACSLVEPRLAQIPRFILD